MLCKYWILKWRWVYRAVDIVNIVFAISDRFMCHLQPNKACNGETNARILGEMIFSLIWYHRIDMIWNHWRCHDMIVKKHFAVVWFILCEVVCQDVSRYEVIWPWGCLMWFWCVKTWGNMTLLFVLERPSEERFLCSASRFFFSLIIRAAANAMILILFPGVLEGAPVAKLVFSRRAKQCAGRVVLRRDVQRGLAL